MAKSGASCNLAPLASAFAREASASSGETSPKRPGREGRPDAPAVILYTSGTTSDPKGVVLTHANLLAERDAAFAVVHVNEHDAVLGVLPLFHSLAQLANLLLPFAVGARVVFLEIGQLDRAHARRWPSATSRSSLRAAVLLPDSPAGHRRGAEGGWLTRRVFRRCSGRELPAARRLGLNLGPHRCSARAPGDGRSHAPPSSPADRSSTRPSAAISTRWASPSPGLRADRDERRGHHHRPDDAHDRHGRPAAAGRDEISLIPADLGRAEVADGEIAIRGPIVMQGYFNRPDATPRP